LILAIWGEEKSFKTTLGLSTVKVSPKLAHQEFDVGGFERASCRFVEEINLVG